MKKSKKVITKLLVMALTVGMIFAAGCSKKTDSTYAVTINDEKLTMQDMMYFIYAMEAQGQMYAQYYPTYWDMEYSEGVTMRDQMKQSVMDAAVMWEILYQKSKEAGNTLTDEEKKSIDTDAESIWSTVKADEERIKLTGFTKDILVKAIEKLQLADKYYQTVLDSLEVNEDEIKAGIDKEAYKQYDTEYLYAATAKYDESYKLVELTDKEKAAAKESIENALKDVKGGKAFADIAKDNEALTTTNLKFVKGDNTADAAYQEAAMKLKNDEVTDGIITTPTGYYIIKMTNNNSTESYDAAVTEAISNAQTKAFTEKYDNEIKKEYTIKVNDEVWNKVIMGETTIPVAERITSTPTPESTTTPEATDTPAPTKSGK